MSGYPDEKGYGDPPPGYGAPPPQQGYGPPPPGYGAPPPGYGAPPPQQGYGAPPPQQGYGAPQTQIIVNAPPPPPRTVAVAAPMRFGEHPCSMTCPYCGLAIVTSRQYTPGSLTWLAGFLIVVVGLFFICPLFLGCCLIPCCIDGCKDVSHTCPSCNREVGKYNRM